MDRMNMVFLWRMDKPCDNCPFSSSLSGQILARSLHKGRLNEIKKALRQGQHFICHKTTHATGDGSEKLCAGAIEWSNRRGCSSNLQRIMERLDAAQVK